MRVLTALLGPKGEKAHMGNVNIASIDELCPTLSSLPAGPTLVFNLRPLELAVLLPSR